MWLVKSGRPSDDRLYTWASRFRETTDLTAIEKIGAPMHSERSVKRHVICAIVTPNYLRKFLILGESIAMTMPKVDVRVLVLQDCDDVGPIQMSIDAYVSRQGCEASHRVVTIDECDWGDFDIESAALFYDILEFATSVKPALMRSLVREGWDRVTYLDPDMQVFKDFSPLLHEAAELTLTPHFLVDIPRDDHRPTTQDVLMAGFFNLGFCSIRATGVAFLDWWSARLQFECLNDHHKGFFTDQKLVDLAQLRATIQILKDPGCNVAYWNLHERRVVADSDGWAVDVDGYVHPLYFFHFSGFREHGPSLSIHSSRKVVGDAVPRAFVSQYARQIRHSTAAEEPYPFTLGGATLDEPIPRHWNTCVRQDTEVHVRAGHSLREVRELIYAPDDPAKWASCQTCGELHDNFGTRVRSFLVGWAIHPSLDGVPNGIAAFHRTAHFEAGAPAMDQLSWATGALTDQLAGNDGLAQELLRASADAVRDAVGLKLVGYFSFPAGMGQIARWALRTLTTANLNPAIDRIYALSDSDEHLSALLRRHNPLAASNSSVLCFVNADQWRIHVTDGRRVNLRTQHVEAVWAWELEQIPTHMFEAASSGEIARVHALSNWSAAAMAKILPVPVQRLAPFSVELFDFPDGRAQSVISPRVEGRYLLTTLDAKSFLSRKNPEGVLELWRRVQSEFPNHRLVIKSVDLRDFASAELLDLIDESERTLLLDEYLTDETYFDLLAGCDVFVSLHRSEGMGLAPIEAGLRGLPVVYTNYGGVVDFLQGGFFPVSYEMVRVDESVHDNGPYDGDALWAEPDIDDAVRQLRLAFALAESGEAAATLIVDKKQLVENLINAQAEVVATAERLLRMDQDFESVEDRRLHIELTRPPVMVSLEMPAASLRPNPVLYGLVATVWSIYKMFPSRLRYQFNIALNKLRGARKRP